MSRRIGDEEIREGSELPDERTRITEVKRRMLAAKDALIADEVNDEEI